MPTEESDIKYRILFAAKKLFAKQGFDATTVRQICEEAGANVALVSYHFGGKNNVFSAIFEMFFPGILMSEWDKYRNKPVEGIRELLKNVIYFRMSDPEMVAIFQREISSSSPRVETIQRYLHPIWRMLRSFLEEGRNQGLFRFNSLDNTLLFILGTVVFYRNNSFLDPLLSDPFPSFDQLYEDTCQFIFGGLGYTHQN
ncbi:TetR family transcriptional regulator [Paenibacillus sediminis]|uniref:AcrR family transcriptional regulator n=1 Tax=Paenibacillus sediminis TaxID=664909 RepID=A0ABS4H2S1_9BACL|nr:TetR family transcriptional regulator [Paenibacillus sediminis]MBP1936825.1 AcrR family transcriptional regulator [Paenibacillus sediminis]